MSIPRINPALLIGVAVLILALSGTAYAAGASNMIIQGGSSTNKASVDKAGQLLAAEATPGQHVNVSMRFIYSDTCTSVYQVPAGKGLVLQDVTYTFYPDSSGYAASVAIYRGAGCSGVFTGLQAASLSAGSFNEPLGAGYILPAGTILTGGASHIVGANLMLSGYLVPAAATTATVSHGSQVGPAMRFQRGAHRQR